MKHHIYFKIAAALMLCSSFALAAPADSLMNVKTWEVADGGNGHTYALVAYRTTWDSGFVYASEMELAGQPGYLATATSQAENDFILNNIIVEETSQNAPLEQFDIGGLYENNTWGWITGEPFTFTNWADGEPNNVGIETVLAMWGFKPSEIGFPSGQWNNTLPDTSINPEARQWSIVEWDTSKTPKTIVIPNPISAVMYRPYDELSAQIYIGDFEGLYTADDVDQSTLMINGSHTPDNVETVTHAIFTGEALKLYVPIQNFVGDYYPFWGESVQAYTVSGMYNDATPFEFNGEFKAIGHILGDINRDGLVNVIDLNQMVNWWFRNGKPPRFPEVADVNGSCGPIDVLDLSYMVNHIIRGGPPPVLCNE